MRTKTLVKNAIIQIDATPFKQWYEQHYGVKVGVKKGKKAAAEKEDAAEVKQSKSVQKKILERQKLRTLVCATGYLYLLCIIISLLKYVDITMTFKLLFVSGPCFGRRFRQLPLVGLHLFPSWPERPL